MCCYSSVVVSVVVYNLVFHSPDTFSVFATMSQSTSDAVLTQILTQLEQLTISQQVLQAKVRLLLHSFDTPILLLVVPNVALTFTFSPSNKQLDAITSQSQQSSLPGAPTSRTAAVPIPHRKSSPPLPLSSSFSHPQIISSSPSTSAFGISPPGPLAGRLPSKSLQQDREKVLYPQRVILTSESRFPALCPLSHPQPKRRLEFLPARRTRPTSILGRVS